jgi:penicillin amidase
MSAGSVAPSIFEFFRITFAEGLLADDLGEMFSTLPAVYRDYYIYKTILTGADSLTDRKETGSYTETLDDIIKESFQNGIIKLDGFVSDNDLKSRKWGEIHVLRLDHPMGSVRLIDKIFKLNSPSYPVGGSDHTVSPYKYGPGFMVVHGASQRHIYNTADWDDSWSIIPTGNSGVPGSPFYLSQTQTYVSGQFYRDYFSEKAVKENAAHTFKLSPAR